MSDKKFSEEYKNIVAPSELYGRILNSASSEEKKSNVVQFRRVGTLAAVFAVIILIGLFMHFQNVSPEIYVAGEKLNGEIAIQPENAGEISLARMGTSLSCELTVEIKSPTEITPLSGVITDLNGELLLNEGESGEFENTLDIKWTVPFADKGNCYEILLSDENGTYTVKLLFDGEQNSWIIREEN